VHLSNLDEDMGERHNLEDAQPALTAELTDAARAWREGIERRWRGEFSVDRQGKVTH